MSRKKKKKLHQLSNEEKLIKLFENAKSYDRGLDIRALSQYLYGDDTDYLRIKTRQVIGRVKWYYLLAKGYVLGSVSGPSGWRYCLVAAKEEAAKVQHLYARNAAGNLKRAILNTPVLAEAGLLEESLEQTLLQYEPFADLKKLLEGGNGNANKN